MHSWIARTTPWIDLRGSLIWPQLFLRGLRLLTALTLLSLCASYPVFGQESGNITSLSHHRVDGLTLTIDSLPGYRYRIESSANLQAPWQLETELVSPGNTLQWTDSKRAIARQRYYRVAVSPPTTTGNTLTELALLSVDALPPELILASGTSRQLGAEGVYLASQLGAAGLRLVTTGTLTQKGNQWSYATEPNDRLRLVFQEGNSADYYMTKMEGDFSGNAAQFLSSNHVFQWRSVSSEHGDLSFTSTLNGRINEVTVRGTYKHQGTTYTLDLTSFTDHFFEGGGSAHTITDTTVTGTIRGDAYLQNVEFRNRFEIISNMQVSASTNEAWINSQLIIGDKTFAWNQVKKQKSFLSGFVSQLATYWNASGTITENDVTVGTYQFKFVIPTPAALGYARFVVATADGDQVLESWTVRPGEGG